MEGAACALSLLHQEITPLPEQEGEESRLKSALTSRVQENKFIVVNELKFDDQETKNFQNVMNNLNVKKALVVLDSNNTEYLSARTLQTLRLLRWAR